MLQATTLRPLNVRTDAKLYTPIVRTMPKGEVFYVADDPIIVGAFQWRQHVRPDGTPLERYSAEKYTGGSGIVYISLKPIAQQKVVISLPMSVGEILKIHDLRMVFNRQGEWMFSYSTQFAMIKESM